MNSFLSDKIEKSKDIIKKSKKVVAFTGAGISVASGIPTFRGKNGLWSKFDPTFLDLDFFINNPKRSWELIKDIFYTFLDNVSPNDAHFALAEMGCPVITQNIDNLHQMAGSSDIVEFHGTANSLVCLKCGLQFKKDKIDLSILPPKCIKCGGILKPDFVFFKEPIPDTAYKKSITLSSGCGVMIVVGTTGEIMPASQIPYLAKKSDAFIIEVNTNPSNYTNTISDLFLHGKAEEILPMLV